jgi:phage baseplate assembly protein W
MTTPTPTEYAIKLPFSFDSYGNVFKTGDQNDIWKDRVISALGTAAGERVMRSDYGTKIPSLFFDTQDALVAGITKEVTAAFTSYLPLLTLLGVNIAYDELSGQMTADVSYKLPNQTSDVTSVNLSSVIINKANPPYEEKL